MNDNNFWYYTLSSTSQTLAALVALSATFVIFKLDQINRLKKEFIDKMFRFLMIFNYKKNIHELLPLLKTDEGVKELLSPINYLKPELDDLGFENFFIVRGKLTKKDASEAYRKCNDYMNSIIIGFHGQHKSTNIRLWGYLKYQQEYYETLIKTKNNIYHKLKFSLILNSLTIILSLSFISFDNINKCYLYFITLIIIIMAIVSIIYTTKSIWDISHSVI
jgi:hypothetical protein